jgi:peptidyl-tRNA hydrolase, PTH1 family
MKLVVGLGNPGTKYQFNLHNVGFLLLDLLSERFGFEFSRNKAFDSEISKAEIFSEKCLLIKPSTFMNLSGNPVAKVARYYGISCEDVIVIHDDLDLPELEVRFKKSGGHGGHNGIRSMIASLGDDKFARIKVGIGRPEQGSHIPMSDWVLTNFKQDKLELFHGEIMDKIAEHLQKFLQSS